MNREAVFSDALDAANQIERLGRACIDIVGVEGHVAMQAAEHGSLQHAWR